MFISLRWKATLAIATIFLSLCTGFMYFNAQHLERLSSVDRQAVKEQHLGLITGLINQSDKHLQQLGNWIPQSAKLSNKSVVHIINQNWLYIQTDWDLEGVILFSSNGNAMKSWGAIHPLPKKLVLDTLSGQYKGTKIQCTDSCSQSLLMPILTKHGPMALQFEIKIDKLLSDFRNIAKAEIGIISRRPSQSKDANHLHSWGQSLIHLTQAESSQQIVDRLSREYDFATMLNSSVFVQEGSNTYDVSLMSLPQLLDSRYTAVVVENITANFSETAALRETDLISVILPLLFGGIIVLILTLIPINRMIHQSKIMLLIIKGDNDAASSYLGKQKPRRFLRDEIDMLLESEGELSNHIDQLNMQLQESTDELKNLAMFDDLTGLANRYSFFKEIKLRQRRYKRSKTQFGLLFLDLDNFKRINDSLGHSAGDKLLGVVSNRLKSCVRATDVVGRLGGDEFCILVDTLNDPEETKAVALQVLNTLILPIHISGTEINISASIGIVVAPNDGNTTEELLQNADLAMYQAKELGKNKYCSFSKELTLRAARQLTLENELRSALANREFLLYFQPQVHIHNSEICGIEALIRWNHPERGFQGPDSFIDALEETGLIVPVGEWILRESCRLVSSWIESGITPLKVAVNISPRQFSDPNFFSMVEQTIAATGLPTKYLELEITESMVMGNMEESFELLNNLRKLGVTLSIDDFGTGYSSLSYLKTLPVDILKVDRAFVIDIPNNESDMEITAAIIAMAHKLKLKVVAEGIENPEQHEFLNANHCDYGQGYLFSKPLSQKDLLELLQNQQQLNGPNPEVPVIARA